MRAEVEVGSRRALRSRAERSESPNRLRTGARGGSQVLPGVQGAEPPWRAGEMHSVGLDRMHGHENGKGFIV